MLGGSPVRGTGWVKTGQNLTPKLKHAMTLMSEQNKDCLGLIGPWSKARRAKSLFLRVSAADALTVAGAEDQALRSWMIKDIRSWHRLRRSGQGTPRFNKRKPTAEPQSL